MKKLSEDTKETLKEIDNVFSVISIFIGIIVIIFIIIIGFFFIVILNQLDLSDTINEISELFLRVNY